MSKPLRIALLTSQGDPGSGWSPRDVSLLFINLDFPEDAWAKSVLCTLKPMWAFVPEKRKAKFCVWGWGEAATQNSVTGLEEQRRPFAVRAGAPERMPFRLRDVRGPPLSGPLPICILTAVFSQSHCEPGGTSRTHWLGSRSLCPLSAGVSGGVRHFNTPLSLSFGMLMSPSLAKEFCLLFHSCA